MRRNAFLALPLITMLLCSAPQPSGAQSTVDPAKVVEALTWSPDGSMIAASYADGRIDVLGAQSGEVLRTIDDFAIVQSLDWSPSLTSLLAIGGSLGDNPGVVVVVDPTTGDFRFTLNAGYSVRAVRWDPTGERIAAASNNAGFSATNGDEVLIWDSATGELRTRAPLGVYGHNITAIDWSPDGSQIVGGSSNATLVIWDATNGERTKVLSETGVVLSLDWSSEATDLAVSVFGIEDRNTHVWNTDDWVRLLSIPANSATVEWQPGGAQLALGELQHLRVIDVAAGQPMVDLSVSGAVKALAFSPLGDQLAFGGLPMPASSSLISNALEVDPAVTLRSLADGTIWIVSTESGWVPGGPVNPDNGHE